MNVVDSSFTSNYASAKGGAIFNAGRLDVANSNFSGNTTDNNGAAIFNASTGDAKIHNSVIVGNVSRETGGGIENRGRLLVENSQIVDNRVIYGTTGGAGLYNDFGANAVIRNSEISRNVFVPIRYGIGGAGILTCGNLEVSSSTIAGNSVVVPSEDGILKGGGINVQAGFVNVTNTLFDSNFARQGGAIHVENGTARVESSRFIGNTSENRFGGNNFFSPDTREGAGSAWSTSNGGLTLVYPYFENNLVTAAGGDFGNSRVSRVANSQPQGYTTIISATPTSGTTTPSGSQVSTGVYSMPRTSVNTNVSGRVNIAANLSTAAGIAAQGSNTNPGRILR